MFYCYYRHNVLLLTLSTLSNFNGLFHSLFWIKLNRSVVVKGLILTPPVGSRKLAVVCMGLGCDGISFFPSAILTMEVIWVSGPNTWIGTPRVFPAKQIYKMRIYECVNNQIYLQRGFLNKNGTHVSESIPVNILKAQRGRFLSLQLF